MELGCWLHLECWEPGLRQPLEPVNRETRGGQEATDREMGTQQPKAWQAGLSTCQPWAPAAGPQHVRGPLTSPGVGLLYSHLGVT